MAGPGQRSRTSLSATALVKSMTIAAICVALAQTCPGASAAPEAKSDLVDVIVVHQNSTAFGKCDLYLTPQAARFYGRGGEIIIMTKAPQWHTLLYSKTKNQGYELNQEEAKKSKLGVFSTPISLTPGQLKKYRDSLLKIDAGRVVTTGNVTSVAHDAFIFQDRKKRMVKDMITEIYEPFPFSPPLQKFINWLYSFGYYSGIPLDLTVHYDDGVTANDLHTISIEKVRKPAAFFDYVSHFKKAKNTMTVLVSEDINTTLEDLLGDTPSKHK